MDWYEKYKEMKEENERLREKIVRAIACIEDELYSKAEILLQQALKEHKGGGETG